MHDWPTAQPVVEKSMHGKPTPPQTRRAPAAWGPHGPTSRSARASPVRAASVLGGIAVVLRHAAVVATTVVGTALAVS